MQEAWVRSLGGEDPLVKGMATHSSISCLENPMDRGAWQATVHGVTKSGANTGWERKRTVDCKAPGALCGAPADWERLSPPGSHALDGQDSLTPSFQLSSPPCPLQPHPQATAPQMAPIKGLCFVSIFPK